MQPEKLADDLFKANESNETEAEEAGIPNDIENEKGNSEDFIFCYKCGTKQPMSNKFCHECGAKIVRGD